MRIILLVQKIEMICVLLLFILCSGAVEDLNLITGILILVDISLCFVCKIIERIAEDKLFERSLKNGTDGKAKRPGRMVG